MLSARDKDFLPVDDVVIAIAFSPGANTRGVSTTGRFGNTEGLQPQLSSGNARQIAIFLVLIAMLEQRPHGVHLGVAGTAVTAAALDFFEDRTTRLYRQSGTAVGLGDEHRKKSRLRKRPHEFGGIGGRVVQSAPVFARILGTQLGHRFSDFRVVGIGRTHRHPAGDKGIFNLADAALAARLGETGKGDAAKWKAILAVIGIRVKQRCATNSPHRSQQIVHPGKQERQPAERSHHHPQHQKQPQRTVGLALNLVDGGGQVFLDPRHVLVG